MKQAGGNRKPGGGAAAGAGRQNLGRSVIYSVDILVSKYNANI